MARAARRRDSFFGGASAQVPAASVTRNATYRLAGQVRTKASAHALKTVVPISPSVNAVAAKVTRNHRPGRDRRVSFAANPTTAATTAATPKTPTTHQANQRARSRTVGASCGYSG